MISFAAFIGTIAWLGGAWVAQPPENPPDIRSQEALEHDGTAKTLTVVKLQAEGVSWSDLQDALVLRLPHVRFESGDGGTDAIESPGFQAFVGIDLVAGEVDTFQISVILDDGRGYFRSIEGEGNDVVRLLASNITNLLLAIESGAVEPDRHGVEFPLPPAAGAAPRTESAGPQSEAPSQTERNDQAVGLGDGSNQPATATVDEVPSPRKRRPIIVVGGLLDFELGLGPPAGADRFVSWGGGVRGGVRLAKGALFGLSAQVRGRTDSTDLRLIRMRIAAGAGYSWLHHRAIMIDTEALATIEPWWLTGQGLTSSDENPPMRPLVGFALRCLPGYRWALGRGTWGLSLNAMVELAASGIFDGGVRYLEVTIQTDDGERVAFRAGGVELSFGLQVAFWFQA